jgi:hypothetical protein
MLTQLAHIMVRRRMTGTAAMVGEEEEQDDDEEAGVTVALDDRCEVV